MAIITIIKMDTEGTVVTETETNTEMTEGIIGERKETVLMAAALGEGGLLEDLVDLKDKIATAVDRVQVLSTRILL